MNRLEYRLQCYAHIEDWVRKKWSSTAKIPQHVQPHVRMLRRYLDYTDIIHDCLMDSLYDVVPRSDWVCRELEEWLIIENKVGRHAPDDVAKYRAEHNGQLDLNWDAALFGASLIISV